MSKFNWFIEQIKIEIYLVIGEQQLFRHKRILIFSFIGRKKKKKSEN